MKPPAIFTLLFVWALDQL